MYIILSDNSMLMDFHGMRVFSGRLDNKMVNKIKPKAYRYKLKTKIVAKLMSWVFINKTRVAELRIHPFLYDLHSDVALYRGYIWLMDKDGVMYKVYHWSDEKRPMKNFNTLCSDKVIIDGVGLFDHNNFKLCHWI